MADVPPRDSGMPERFFVGQTKAFDINFGRTAMMQRELQSQQDTSVSQLLGSAVPTPKTEPGNRVSMGTLDAQDEKKFCARAPAPCRCSPAARLTLPVASPP